VSTRFSHYFPGLNAVYTIFLGSFFCALVSFVA
jgi:hypothetical protein